MLFVFEVLKFGQIIQDKNLKVKQVSFILFAFRKLIRYNTYMAIIFDDEKQKKNLSDLRKQEEEELVQALAQDKYGIPPINLMGMIIDNEALRSVSEKDAISLEIAPFKLIGRNVHVAVRSPQPEKLESLKAYFTEHNFIPHFYMASLSSLQKAWDRYKEISYASESKMGTVTISGDALKKIMLNIKTMDDIKNAIVEAEKDKIHTTSHILEIVLAGAIAIGASDIHFEPEENTIRLRLRLDGVLHELIEISPFVHKFINSRIKLISGLKITNSSIAQDGRFSIFLDENEISLRVSIMPGAYGESIVMRILNPKSIRVKLEDMGIEPKLYEIFMREIKKPNGLILLTGPTGSGKTTTLYSFLQRIYSDEIKTWKKYLVYQPDNAAAHYRLGLLLATTSPADALPELMQADRLDPSLEPSVESLRSALNTAALSDDHAYEFLVSGRALGALGNWDLAAEAFRNAITVRADYAEAWAWLGEAKQQQGQDGSVEIKQAMAFNPDSAMVESLYGMYLQRQKQPKQALAAIQGK